MMLDYLQVVKTYRIECILNTQIDEKSLRSLASVGNKYFRLRVNVKNVVLKAIGK